MSAFIWDNSCVNTTGENFGYVNHGTGAYIGQGENVYDNAPK